MIDDAEDFNLVMSMYNLIEYSSAYSKDEATNFNADIANNYHFHV